MHTATQDTDDDDTETENSPTISSDKEMLERSKGVPCRPHRDPPILRYLYREEMLSHRDAAERIERVTGDEVHHSSVKRQKDEYGIKNPAKEGAFADVLGDDGEGDTEPAQPPSFALDRSTDTPVHPFDTDCYKQTEPEEGSPECNTDNTPPTSPSVPTVESQSSQPSPDSAISRFGRATGVYKGPIGLDPSDYRLEPSQRDGMVAAPPEAVYSGDYPDLYMACGCGNCDERHYLDTDTEDTPDDYEGPFADVLDDGTDGEDDGGESDDSDGWSCDCPSPVPVTIAGARRIYRHAVGPLHADGAKGNAVDRALGKYRQLMRADSAILRSADGEDTYQTSVNDDETTALVSLRLSPTDDEGRLVTPYELLRDVRTAWKEARDNLPDGGDSPERVAYYWIITGTDDWATAHVHCYLWFLDPRGAVAEDDFETVVRTFHDHSQWSAYDAHLEPNTDAVRFMSGGERVAEDQLTDGVVRVEHAPLLADPERLADDLPDRVEDGHDAQSRGAIYVATQLPHLALLGRETDADAEFAAFAHLAAGGGNYTSGDDGFYAHAEVLDVLS